MKRITLQDLMPVELKELKFGVEDLGLYTEDEKRFIYANLYRGEDGLVYFYNLGEDGPLVPLYV